jgi:hypothetical protein
MKGTKMKYDYRIELVKKELENILSSYAVPVHMRHDEAAKQSEIKVIAKAVNQIFPSDTTREVIEGAFSRAELKIKAAHMSRTWPKGADIVTAIQYSLARADYLPHVSTNWHPDPKIINAQRIKKGEPVGEFYIYGKMADELIRDGLVTEHDLQPYKEYLAVEKIDRI